MQRKYFLGMSAVVYAPEGTLSTSVAFSESWVLPFVRRTQVAVWGAPGTVDKKTLISVDMEKRIDRYTGGQIGWDDVYVDGPGLTWNGTAVEPRDLATTPGDVVLTSIGRTWPFGTHLGVVYLESAYAQTHRDIIERGGAGNTWPCAPHNAHPYEGLTIAYSKDGSNGNHAGRRYMGFLGKIVDDQGRFKKVELSQSREGKTAPLGTWWFDTADATECDVTIPEDALAATYFHPTTGAYPKLKPAALNAEGGFYIDIYRARELMKSSNHGLAVPKFPFFLGS